MHAMFTAEIAILKQSLVIKLLRNLKKCGPSFRYLKVNKTPDLIATTDQQQFRQHIRQVNLYCFNCFIVIPPKLKILYQCQESIQSD